MLSNWSSKQTLTAGVITAVFTWAYDFVVHGNLLKDMYAATAHLWRPMSQMEQMWQWCIAYHLAMGILFASGYRWWRSNVKCGKVGSDNCPYRKSIGFGLWVGLLLGAPQVMTYMWLPMPLDLSLAWAASEVVKWSLAGLVLAKFYRA